MICDGKISKHNHGVFDVAARLGASTLSACRHHQGSVEILATDEEVPFIIVEYLDENGRGNDYPGNKSLIGPGRHRDGGPDDDVKAEDLVWNFFQASRDGPDRISVCHIRPAGRSNGEYHKGVSRVSYLFLWL